MPNAIDSHGPLFAGVITGPSKVTADGSSNEPGILVWHLPHGRKYTVRPQPHPV